MAVAAVTDLAASDIEKTALTLTWDNPVGVVSLIVRRAAGATAPATSSSGTNIAVAGTAETVDDSGLTADTTYSYGVWAVHAEAAESDRVAITVTTAPNTEPHSASGYGNPAQSSPAETETAHSQGVASARTSYDRSAESSKEQYEDLTGVQEQVPTITSIDPSTAEEGTGPVTVTITGTGFMHRTTVLWGEDETVLEATINSATEIEVEVPDELEGTYDIVIDNTELKVSDPEVFTYTAAG